MLAGMITVPLINWQPIESMPEDRKDGRMVLLWDGGPDIGSWNPSGIWGASGFWEAQYEGLPIEAPRFWADINPPE
jgi:hypothetical protein